MFDFKSYDIMILLKVLKEMNCFPNRNSNILNIYTIVFSHQFFLCLSVKDGEN